MLPSAWQSDRFIYDLFEPEEAKVAKSIYDSTESLLDLDPHFGIYPLAEFDAHIENDQTGEPRDGTPKFYLRCIRDKESNEALGYFQFEVDAPEQGMSWLPMFVLNPAARNRGVGREAVKSLIETVGDIGSVEVIGLNVYAENSKAFQFWVKAGWNRILGVDLESHHDKSYTSVTLSLSL